MWRTCWKKYVGTDLLDLKANPKRRAVGSIIESSLDKGRGYVSTVLVENGTLKVGDIVLAGTHFGRVKAMFNERNQRIEKAGPSEPALILGLNGAPQAGDTFNVLETDQEAAKLPTVANSCSVSWAYVRRRCLRWMISVAVSQSETSKN